MGTAETSQPPDAPPRIILTDRSVTVRLRDDVQRIRRVLRAATLELEQVWRLSQQDDDVAAPVAHARDALHEAAESLEHASRELDWRVDPVQQRN